MGKVWKDSDTPVLYYGCAKVLILFEEINSLLSEARLFGWLMNSTLQWDSNPGPWNKAPSRQQYMNNALTN